MTEIIRMKTANGDGLELTRYEDLTFPKMDGLDPLWGINHAKEFKYKPGDIITCTYPKCGIHWLGNMMWKFKTFDSSKRTPDTMIEVGPAEIYDIQESPRLIFTHLKPSRLPPEHIKNGGKIILMLRNPKDVMVSMYYHWKNAVLFQNKQTWDEFFQSFISGVNPWGSYFDYVQQWEDFLKNKSTQKHVEIFYYEDFKANLNYNVARLNHILGFNRDQTYIERIIQETTLSALREQDASGKRETHPTVRDEKGDSVIYRKGVVGDWKKHLTVAQSETVDKIMEEMLKYGIINIKYCI